MNAVTGAAIIASALMLGACAAWPPPPDERRMLCYPRLELLARLRDNHGEVVVARGMTMDLKMVEIVASPAGTWTAIISGPVGDACVVKIGRRWRFNAPGDIKTPAREMPLLWWPAALRCFFAPLAGT